MKTHRCVIHFQRNTTRKQRWRGWLLLICGTVSQLNWKTVYHYCWYYVFSFQPFWFFQKNEGYSELFLIWSSFTFIILYDCYVFACHSQERQWSVAWLLQSIKKQQQSKKRARVSQQCDACSCSQNHGISFYILFANILTWFNFDLTCFFI